MKLISLLLAAAALTLGLSAQAQESALRKTLAERIPLHHVASYLGITNVALSRIRARMGLVRGRR